jgi:hypothetical protein
LFPSHDPGGVDLDSAGGDVVSIPFNNLHTAIQNTSTDNPKTILIHFNRTVFLNQVGLGCADHPGDSFSNVVVKVLGSGEVERETFDDSANNTKLTSYNYQFGPEVCNAVLLEFHTADPITITNITIQKVISTSSILRATKPDGTITDIDATQGGNLKVSLEEIESQISDDNNQRLMTSPYIVDEFGTVARLLGDNIFQGSLITISPEHHEIHCGDSYELSFTEILANGGVLDLLIVVPNETPPFPSQDQKLYHFKGSVDSEAEAMVEFFEGTVVSDNGTIRTPFSRNRNTTFNDYLPMYTGPTITTDGTKLFEKTIGNGKSVGGAVDRADEFVLGNNTVYLLRVTNNTVSSNYVNVSVDYYIHPGV